MNLAEFNIEFDIGYNNSFSFKAPPINIFEKSVYLTQAQEDIVLEKAKVYETDERVREQLRNIVRSKIIAYDAILNSNLVSLKFNTYSKFFEVPTDTWFLYSEYINDEIKVIPITHDEYNINKNNPFKQPNEVKAWRLDVYNSISSENVREIIYPTAITTYTIRYMVKPTPIILESLTPYGYTIDGLAVATPCILSSELHRDIIELAIQKAKKAYEENTLQNRVVSNRDN
jgi:sRNA-binding carbon storage regulator CsrA